MIETRGEPVYWFFKPVLIDVFWPSEQSPTPSKDITGMRLPFGADGLSVKDLCRKILKLSKVLRSNLLVMAKHGCTAGDANSFVVIRRTLQRKRRRLANMRTALISISLRQPVPNYTSADVAWSAGGFLRFGVIA